jgi:hypothetical protein
MRVILLVPKLWECGVANIRSVSSCVMLVGIFARGTLLASLEV